MTTNPIRIVPLADAVRAMAPATPPKLTFRNGALLQSVKVFTLFWGKAWTTSPDLVKMAGQVNDFFRYVLTSPLMDAMAEYNVPGKSIQHGALIGTANTATPAPKASVKDASIQSLIQKLITKGTLPHATPDTLYFVFTPPGTKVVDGKDASCSQFCGYHNQATAGFFYAAMPYPDCNGCLDGMPAFDALTGTTSHELCEAITDPVPGTGWYDDANGEIGDICAWKFKKLGGYTVQLEWSNKANNCV